MKKFLVISIALLSIQYGLSGQTIDHRSIDLESIPDQWIESAKANLHIGYGHTSHGSQIASGMDAIEAFYTDGTYNWSHTGGEGELHLFEGDGYGDGYLDHDVGYAGWDDETRTYLDVNPECNVIIWSWCGQVNDVDLQTHLFDNMEQLETEYPNVTFVYMTGHLEGLGPNGSIYTANQQIRNYCSQNGKFLFDFADIEKYSPDADTNYQNYFADDECNYELGGETKNWATNWLDANPSHGLTQIASHCSSCSHSVSINCVKKGIAAWHLWAQLAGWDGIGGSTTNSNIKLAEFDVTAYAVPGTNVINVAIQSEQTQFIDMSLYSLTGSAVYTKTSIHLMEGLNELRINQASHAKGIYFLETRTKTTSKITKLIVR